MTSDFTAIILPVDIMGKEFFSIRTNRTVPGLIVSRSVENENGMLRLFDTKEDAINYCIGIDSLILC